VKSKRLLVVASFEMVLPVSGLGTGELQKGADILLLNLQWSHGLTLLHNS
jgi:hypothetical protein